VCLQTLSSFLTGVACIVCVLWCLIPSEQLVADYGRLASWLCNSCLWRLCEDCLLLYPSGRPTCWSIVMSKSVCLLFVCEQAYLWSYMSEYNILYALSIASPRWTVLWYVMYLQIYGWHYNCTWRPECVMQIRRTLYLGSRIRYCNTYLNWPTRTSLDRGRSVTSMIALLMCQFNWWHRLIRKCSTWVHRAFWRVASYSVVRSMAICETHSSHSLAWGLPVHKSTPRGRHSTTPISHRCITSPASVSQDSLQCC